MGQLLTWLDDYDRTARLIPGLYALAPAIVFCLVLGLQDQTVLTLLISAFMTIGGPVGLAGIVRYRGKNLETRLWPQWGGPPTTELLRVGQSPSALTVSRRKEVSRATGLALPDVAAEAKDPAQADAQYDAAIRKLREATRDQSKFALVYKENKNYGFARYLRAVRPYGLALAAIVSVILTGLFLTRIRAGLGPSPLSTVIGLVVSLGLVALWVFFVTEAMVRQAAVAYAERLLDSAATLP